MQLQLAGDDYRTKSQLTSHSKQDLDKTPSKKFFLRCDLIHTFFV